jgi:hypothetical protein
MVELTRDIIDAEHYVARYVRGGLSAAQREAFEDFCVMNPDVAAQVDTDRALLTGLRGLDPKPYMARSRPVWRYAMAACVALILVAIGTIGYRELTTEASLGLHADAKELQPLALAHLSAAFVISPVRGARAIEIRVPDDVRALQLNFDPGVHDATEFDFKLFEHTESGAADRGQLRVSRQVHGDRIVPLFIELGEEREPRLRLDVLIAGAHESFELRVIRQ